MKKGLIAMLAPVVALLPQGVAAQDDSCKVGKQVFEFKPTGKSFHFGKPNRAKMDGKQNRNLKWGKNTERSAATGYMKIPDIEGESQRSQVYPKTDNVMDVQGARRIDKSSPLLAQYAAKGVRFIKWDQSMMKQGAMMKAPVIETASGAKFVKIGDIKGESLASSWIDKSTPMYKIESGCK